MRIYQPPRRHSLWPLFVGAASLMALLTLAACSMPRTPEGIQPVTGFDANRFTGHWHEVARIDHSFERGLRQASATYSRNDDGSLHVINRGYDPRRMEWKEVEGTARFTGDPTRAALQVSFFGPFAGGYNVVALDENYQWAMVMGSSRDHLWILSRTPYLSWHVRDHLVERARIMGVDVGKIVWAQDHPTREQHARRAVMT